MIESKDEYCFACGEKNPIGLHLKFEFEGEKIVTKKNLAREYEGYEGIAHGGIITTILDETMCHFIKRKYNENAVTGRLEVRYHSTTPIDEELKISAWQESQRRNIITMKSCVEKSDGTITAEATAKFAVVSLK